MRAIAMRSRWASTSCLVTPADLNVSSAASMSMSSVPLSQCSRNGIHPAPMMATLSLMPCEPMHEPPVLGGIVSSGPYGAALPEIVVDAVGRVQTAERHLDSHTNRDTVGIDIGQ